MGHQSNIVALCEIAEVPCNSAYLVHRCVCIDVRDGEERRPTCFVPVRILYETLLYGKVVSRVSFDAMEPSCAKLYLTCLVSLQGQRSSCTPFAEAPRCRCWARISHLVHPPQEHLNVIVCDATPSGKR